VSTGGNVPTQGIVVSEATTEKKRGERGRLGKGTPGSRVKSLWSNFGAPGESLKLFVRRELKNIVKNDGQLWLDSKRPGGTDAQRKIRKEARKERAARNAAAKAAKKASKSSGGSKKKKESVSGGSWE
jgi:hypothetical protein